MARATTKRRVLSSRKINRPESSVDSCYTAETAAIVVGLSYVWFSYLGKARLGSAHETPSIVLSAVSTCSTTLEIIQWLLFVHRSVRAFY